VRFRADPTGRRAGCGTVDPGFRCASPWAIFAFSLPGEGKDPVAGLGFVVSRPSQSAHRTTHPVAGTPTHIL
jgi:hypothetical protein